MSGLGEAGATDDDQVQAVFARIERELGRLDVLVNNATAVPDLPLLFADTPFWEVPAQMWDDLFDVGLRSHFVASAFAARLLIAAGGGLIVNIPSAATIGHGLVRPDRPVVQSARPRSRARCNRRPLRRARP